VERFRLEVGDVLITKDSELWNDIGVPALVEYTAPNLVCGYHLAILRPRTDYVIGAYLLRASESQPVASQYHVSANGVTRYGLTHESIKNVLLPVPPVSEQQAITRFLDHIDRRINRYIRAKRRLIALLNEQKQAIIHRAVTRGLDPDVPLKPSGVEWLGEIPAHWETCRLKDVLTRPVRNGLFKKKDAFGSGVQLINVSDIYRDDFRVDPSSLERVRATDEEIRTFRVAPGDLFFVRSSLKLEGTGRSAIAVDCAPDAVFECHLVQARPHQGRVLPRFLSFQINSDSLRQYLISRANIVTMATVDQDVLQTCPVFLPGLDEQQAIVRYVDEATKEVHYALAGVRREIDLIREYRTRLIADVVTGKLDVRGVALPDDGEADVEALIDEDLGEEGLDGDGEEPDAWEDVEDGDD
jgi:type I restriction enzyme S subunit